MCNSFIRINYQRYRDASVRVLYASSVASTAGKDNEEVTNARDGIEKSARQRGVCFDLLPTELAQN